MSTICPCCGHHLGFGETLLRPMNAPSFLDKAREEQKRVALEKLLERASEQLGKWHEFYGAKNDPRLPPSGDVRLMEDIDDELRPNAGNHGPA